MLGSRSKTVLLDMTRERLERLRRLAENHLRRLEVEALDLLEQGLQAGTTGMPASPVRGRSKTGLRLELPGELAERLMALADANHRSLAAQAALILQAMMERQQAESHPATRPALPPPAER